MEWDGQWDDDAWREYLGSRPKHPPPPPPLLTPGEKARETRDYFDWVTAPAGRGFLPSYLEPRAVAPVDSFYEQQTFAYQGRKPRWARQLRDRLHQTWRR